jgi:hypothetical protein
MKVNRRKFLKMLGVVFASPLLKACDAIFGTPTTTSTPTQTTLITHTSTPSQTGTSVPPSATSTATDSATPTETQTETATGTSTASATETSTETPTQTPTPATGEFFRLHPFIEAHPEAVFIKRTSVPIKTDVQAKSYTGFAFAQEIFVFGTTSGIPLTHNIAIKANVTYTEAMGNTPEGMGIITDKHFTEGFIEGMKGSGFPAKNMYLREGNWLKNGYCSVDVAYTGYEEMAERTGIQALYFPGGRRITDLTLENLQDGTEVVWKDCPQGVVFKRIGYLAPFNQDRTWLLNIAKYKTHAMGMTLCVKNLQGMCVTPHIRFCEDTQITLQQPEYIIRDFQAGFEDQVAQLHGKHLRDGFPRWDRPGTGFTSGFGMESWAQRTCDSHSVTEVGLNIIEGIYGRNGNAFMSGPGSDGKAQDFLTNKLIFGKDPFRVDIIGTWLAGHEPGNFGLFHIARERGLSNVVNPWEIPVYLWDRYSPQPVSLLDIERTPLVTTYLRRDYNGQTEAQYHLVDEPFDYRSF